MRISVKVLARTQPTHRQINNQRPRMPPRRRRLKTKPIPLLLQPPIKPHLRRHLHRRRLPPSPIHRHPPRPLVRKPAWRARGQLPRVPQAQCALRVRAPGEELAIGGERALVVVAEDDGDDGAVLELGGDLGVKVGGRVGVADEDDGGTAGGVGDEVEEVGGDL